MINLKDIDAAGVGLFAGILSPYLEKISKLGLISDYFQPDMQLTASLISPFAALLCFAYLRFRSQTIARRATLLALIGFFISTLVCWLLSQFVGPVWIPDVAGTILVRVVWRIFYVLVFSAFAAALVAGYLSIKRRGAR